MSTIQDRDLFTTRLGVLKKIRDARDDFFFVSHHPNVVLLQVSWDGERPTPSRRGLKSVRLLPEPRPARAAAIWYSGYPLDSGDYDISWRDRLIGARYRGRMELT
jgi:hypothetical protein